MTSNDYSASPHGVAMLLLALIGLWVVVEILPLSYWRAANVRRRLRYLWRHGHYCAHERHWSDWVPLISGGWIRTCGKCGVEQRRHRQAA